MSEDDSTNRTNVDKELPFKIVTSKRNRQKKNTRVQQQFPAANVPVVAVDLILRKIIETISELKASDYFRQSIAVITAQAPAAPLLSISCLGIGNFSHCHASRHQLAFVLAVKEALNIDEATFHEPVLSPNEATALLRLDCAVHSVNVEGKCALSNATIVYLPHCPKQLTNNLLWRNWSAEQLSMLVLIGNSFTQTVVLTPKRFLDSDAVYIARLLPFTEEHQLWNNYRYKDIFNDIAVHTFEATREAPAALWSLNAEPSYQDSSELITSQTFAALSIQ